MNSRIKAVADAIAADPELASQLQAAQDAEEVTAILSAAGIEAPTQEDLAEVSDEALGELAAAAGSEIVIFLDPSGSDMVHRLARG